MRHAAVNGIAKVISVRLEIGALSDLQHEWVQRYFDCVSRGTVAEGAELDITKVPAVFGAAVAAVDLRSVLLQKTT